ncbi:MAG: hypothetical protein MSA54_04535, partial [Campylobacter sp.]|uniref:hypothetical protein n=1 Tax=Campylobacter sp. TaxID=205 RepID=UPI002AA69A0D
LAVSGTDAKAVNGSANAHLKAGGKNCIGVQLVEKNGATPAHIVFTKESSATGVCDQVQKSDPLKVYLESRLPSDSTATGKMAIGSSTSVY